MSKQDVIPLLEARVPPTELLDELVKVERHIEQALPQLESEATNLRFNLERTLTEIDRLRKLRMQIDEVRHGSIW